MDKKSIIFIKFTPSEKSLVENKRKPCTVADCSSTFASLSNLQMHLDKHHGIKIQKLIDKNSAVQYYCPVLKCKYHLLENAGANFFKMKKYIKQHYLKVHAEKTDKCSKCDKAFGNGTLKMQHERVCGTVFQCIDCKWNYTSRECLLTHCRRKGHAIPPKKPKKLKQTISQPKKPAPIPKETSESVNRTNNLMRRVQSIFKSTPAARIKANFQRIIQKKRKTNETKISQTTQTQQTLSTACQSLKSNDKYKSLELIDEESNDNEEDATEINKNLNNLSYGEDDSSLHYFTVSNFNAGLCHIETQTEFMPFDESNIGASEMDPLLCHMHTQTSDEILTELGFADIQTQTNANDECNELFVSTETQTCFDSHLYMDNISTHTQTSTNCDTTYPSNSSDWPNINVRHNNQCTQTQLE